MGLKTTVSGIWSAENKGFAYVTTMVLNNKRNQY